MSSRAHRGGLLLVRTDLDLPPLRGEGVGVARRGAGPEPLVLGYARGWLGPGCAEGWAGSARAFEGSGASPRPLGAARSCVLERGALGLPACVSSACRGGGWSGCQRRGGWWSRGVAWLVASLLCWAVVRPVLGVTLMLGRSPTGGVLGRGLAGERVPLGPLAWLVGWAGCRAPEVRPRRVRLLGVPSLGGVRPCEPVGLCWSGSGPEPRAVLVRVALVGPVRRGLCGRPVCSRRRRGARLGPARAPPLPVRGRPPI